MGSPSSPPHLSPKGPFIPQPLLLTLDRIHLAKALAGELLGHGPSSGTIAVKQYDLCTAADTLEACDLQGRQGALDGAGVTQGATQPLMGGEGGQMCGGREGCGGR